MQQQQNKLHLKKKTHFVLEIFKTQPFPKQKWEIATMRLSPAEIKFIQDSVAMRFQENDKNENEKDLNETCEDIALQRTDISKIPRIKVTEKNGEFYR